MMGYQLTTEAQDDLEAIAEYIAVEGSVERAIRVLSDFRDAFRKLADMPGMGHFGRTCSISDTSSGASIHM
jgi:plasmid stabilization system protein ParE